jgi:hypothetical protein
MLEGPLLLKKRRCFAEEQLFRWILGRLRKKAVTRTDRRFLRHQFLIGTHSHPYNSFYVNGYYSHDRFQFDEEKNTLSKHQRLLQMETFVHQRLAGVFTTGYDLYSYNTKANENPVNAIRWISQSISICESGFHQLPER